MPVRWINIKKLSLLIIGLLLFCGPGYALEWTDAEIVDSIYAIEGGAKADFLYGIRSVQYQDAAEARRICLRTIRNNRKRYADYGYKQYPDFLAFLQSRYCPTKGKLSKAEKKLNGHWLPNLHKQLAKHRKGGQMKNQPLAEKISKRGFQIARDKIIAYLQDEHKKRGEEILSLKSRLRKLSGEEIK